MASPDEIAVMMSRYHYKYGSTSPSPGRGGGGDSYGSGYGACCSSETSSVLSSPLPSGGREMDIGSSRGQGGRRENFRDAEGNEPIGRLDLSEVKNRRRRTTTPRGTGSLTSPNKAAHCDIGGATLGDGGSFSSSTFGQHVQSSGTTPASPPRSSFLTPSARGRDREGVRNSDSITKSQLLELDHSPSAAAATSVSPRHRHFHYCTHCGSEMLMITTPMAMLANQSPANAPAGSLETELFPRHGARKPRQAPSSSPLVRTFVFGVGYGIGTAVAFAAVLSALGHPLLSSPSFGINRQS